MKQSKLVKIALSYFYIFTFLHFYVFTFFVSLQHGKLQSHHCWLS